MLMAHISIFLFQESSLIGYYSSHGQSHEQVQEDHEATSFTQTPIACISFVDPNPPSPLTVNKVRGSFFVLCQLLMELSAIG